MSLSMIATIVAAVIAAFLLLRLYLVLGRRTGNEQSQPDPFAAPNLPAPPVSLGKPGANAPARPAVRTEIFDPSEPMSLEAQIAHIERVDPEFNERSFLNGARIAFNQIVTAFAKGDEEVLKSALSPSLFESFRRAMVERTQVGQKLATEITAIDQAEILSAKLDTASPAANTAPRILIEVRFVSSQIQKLSQADGTLIEGDGDKPISVTDIWVFARTAKSPDPNWLLVGTRGE